MRGREQRDGGRSDGGREGTREGELGAREEGPVSLYRENAIDVFTVE